VVEKWGEKWGATIASCFERRLIFSVEKWGAKWGATIASCFGLWLIISDVSGRYSLGTNPRGVKDI
jgi:hypothetical protein